MYVRNKILHPLTDKMFSNDSSNLICNQNSNNRPNYGGWEYLLAEVSSLILQILASMKTPGFSFGSTECHS